MPNDTSQSEAPSPPRQHEMKTPKKEDIQKAFPEMEVYFGTPTAEEKASYNTMAFLTPNAKDLGKTPLRSVKRPSKLCYETTAASSKEDDLAASSSSTQEDELAASSCTQGETEKDQPISPTASKESKALALPNDEEAKENSAGNTLLNSYKSHLETISPLRVREKASIAPQSKLQPVRFNMEKIKKSGLPLPKSRLPVAAKGGSGLPVPSGSSKLPRRVPQ